MQIGAESVEPLIAALRQLNDHVQEHAAIALGKLGDDRAIAPLIEKLRKTSGTASVNKEIVRALSELNATSAAPTLQEVYSKHDRKFELLVIQTLGKLNDPSSKSFLLDIVERTADPARLDTTLRRAVLFALLHSEDSSKHLETLLQEVLKDLKNEDEKSREKAIFSLSRISDPRIVAPLVEALHDSSRNVKTAAAQTLKDCSAYASDEVIAALKDADPFVRTSAIEALETEGNKQAVEPILQALNDSERSVRIAAISALDSLADRRAVDPLIEMLKDPDYFLRGMAARALKSIGDPCAIPPLLAATRNLDSSGDDAAEALQMFPSLETYSAWDERITELVNESRSDLPADRLRAVSRLCKMARPTKKIKQALIQALEDRALFEHEEVSDGEPIFSDTFAGGVIGVSYDRTTHHTYDIMLAALEGLRRIFKGTKDPEIVDTLLKMHQFERVEWALHDITAWPYDVKDFQKWWKKNRSSTS